MGFKMKKGGGSANTNTEGSFSSSDSNTINTLKVKAFKDPGAPEGFKSDAPGVTGTIKKLSTTHGGSIVDLKKGESVAGKDIYKIRKIEHARQGYGSQLTKEDRKKVAMKRLTSKNLSATDVAKGLGLSPTVTTIKFDK